MFSHALEGFDDGVGQTVQQNKGKINSDCCHGSLTVQRSVSGAVASGDSRLRSSGIQGLSVDDCEVSPAWKKKLTNLIVKYEIIFSRSNLDCGKATGFCHSTFG